MVKEDNNFWEVSKQRPSLPLISTDLWNRVGKLAPKDHKSRDNTKSIIN